MLKPSEFTKAFSEAYEPELSRQGGILKSFSSGEASGLVFVLDRQTRLRMSEVHTSEMFEWGSFEVAVGSAHDYLQFSSKSNPVALGYETRIRIYAGEVVSSEELLDLPVDVKGCAAEKDVELGLFKEYRQVRLVSLNVSSLSSIFSHKKCEFLLVSTDMADVLPHGLPPFLFSGELPARLPLVRRAPALQLHAVGPALSPGPPGRHLRRPRKLLPPPHDGRPGQPHRVRGQVPRKLPGARVQVKGDGETG